MASRHGKRWRARWTDEHGRRQSETFQFKRDAELFEQRAKARVEEIKHGLRAGLPPDKTFSELCDQWLEHRASQKRSQVHDESIIRAHLRPAFGDLKAREVGVEVADRFVSERPHLSKKTIGNLLTLLVAMLNYAHDLGWLQSVPRIRKPKIRMFDRDYRYLRTTEEIRRFLVSADAEGALVFNLYATAIYTGMRAGELAALRWEHVDFERRLITVERSFDGPTKGGEVRYVPILDALLPVLREWRLKNPLGVVFPNRRGRMQGRSARVFQEVLHRVLDRAGFESTPMGKRTRRYIVFHDLRHTFASHWMMNGGDIFKLQKLLGHKQMTMTQRYAHLAPHAFTEDHGRFPSVAVTPAAVIPLPHAEGS